MSYSLTTLKWGLSHCHDRNVAAGRAPFAGTDARFWAITSGHPEQTIEQAMAEIVADRSTRIAPNAREPAIEGK